MGKTTGSGLRQDEGPSQPEYEGPSETASSCGASTERGERAGGVDADEVRKTIDAVTGATWGTRNRIMAGLFQRDLRTRGNDMPAFAPPGEDIPR